MEKTRYYGLRIGIVMICILDTLRRSFSHRDAFDQSMYVIELLVLVLILAEALVHLTRHLRKRLRLRMVAKCISKGERLLGQTPSDDAWSDWSAALDEWRNDTARRLGRRSRRASAFFLHRRAAPKRYFLGVSREAPPLTTALMEYIENLHKILENEDVYF